MQLPSIVKELGNITGENRVYIEDYVYTYLNNLKEERNPLPSRVALYGYANKNEDKNFYFIYGAAHVIEELEQGKSEENIRQAFFGEYKLIGYVNIYNEKKELPGKKEGYFIFYESNESMQNYLLYCHERRNKVKEQANNIQDEEWKSTKPKAAGRRHRKYGIFQNMLLGICLGITAVAVSIMNDYNRLSDFVETAGIAIEMAEEVK